MKKNILLLLTFLLCISVGTSWAVEECFITWQGDSSGIISTTETSRTNQAAEELYDARYSENGLWFSDDCYGYQLALMALYKGQSVCMDGTWHFEYWELACGPYSCVEEGGTWDVVCGPGTDVDNDGIPDFLDENTIYGNISGDAQEDITVNIYILSCGIPQPYAHVTSDAQGYYAIGNIPNGRYLVGPEEAGYSFSNYKWVDIPQTVIRSYDFTSTELTCDDVDRFLDNNDGTVTDCRTGLTWLQDANCYGIAGSYGDTLNDGECGLTDGSTEGDWRVPTIEELQGIGTDPPTTWDHSVPTNVNWTKPGTPFFGVQPVDEYPYWTSTSRTWIWMDNGLTHRNPAYKILFGYSWPVREAN